jgi:hypothetical protein
VEGEIEAVLRGNRKKREAARAAQDEKHRAGNSAARDQQIKWKQQAEQEFDADEPRCAVPRQVWKDVPRLHQKQIGDEGGPGVDGVIRLVIDRDVAVMRRNRAQCHHHEQDDEQHRQMQRIESREPCFQEFEHGPAAPEIAPACAIDIGQYEARKDEEKLDPQISLAHRQVEPFGAEIFVALAIVEQHEDQGRQRARAGEGADFGRTGSGLAHGVCESL